MEILRSDLDLYFNFKKEEIKKSLELQVWFMQLNLQGFGETIYTFNNYFPIRPLKSNTVNTFKLDNLFSIFLLNDSTIEKFKNTGCLIVGGLGEEINTINELCFHNGKKYTFTRELRIGENGFLEWNDLKVFVKPLTDILIIDPYIFKTSNENIKKNLIEILKILSSKTTYKVKIVIVYKELDNNLKLEDIKQLICSELKVILQKKPDVTFIKTYSEHDRTIITNYIRITGNTFNYWDESGKKINNGKDIVVRSLGDYEYYQNAFKAIDDIQQIVLKGVDVFGDKESNFIRFNILS